MKRAFFVLLLLALTACASPQAAPDNESPQGEIPAPATSTPVPPTPTPAPTDTPAPTATPEPQFPPDPQRVEFQADDGANLVGYYYPAAVESAPVVVLLHWVAGTHCDWVGVNLVQWLQNRGLPEGAAGNPDCADARIRFAFPFSEYPATDRSYAVFTFTFRGLDGGSGRWSPPGWLRDSKAAVQKARSLEGVDPNRVTAIGASIGADGAIDGCGEGCLGALSLSPGGYLGVKYADAVKTLNDAGKPAWCVASKLDGESFPACESAGGDHYRKFIYEKDGHGLSFFAPGFDPKVSQIISDFLQTVFTE